MPTVCQLDSAGFFVSTVDADFSPLEEGVILIPGGCIDAEPPQLQAGRRAHWTGQGWEYFDEQVVDLVADAIDAIGDLSFEARLQVYTDAIQAQLDNFARTRGYNSILAACSYVTSTVPRFMTEAYYCVGLRDQTWIQCYAILDAVQAGEREVPSLDELLAELPVPQWPAAPEA